MTVAPHNYWLARANADLSFNDHFVLKLKEESDQQYIASLYTVDALGGPAVLVAYLKQVIADL